MKIGADLTSFDDFFFASEPMIAIMIVNFNGRTTNMKHLNEIAKKYDLKLIEDAAHSLGSYYKNTHQGTNSDVGVFSFSTPKIITTGQGGMIVTNNKNIYEKCLSLKDFGRESGAKKDMKKSTNSFCN